MKEPEGKDESSASKNSVMAHRDGPNNRTIPPRIQKESNQNERIQIKLSNFTGKMQEL